MMNLLLLKLRKEMITDMLDFVDNLDNKTEH